jgi:hypothetical protein
MSRVDSSAILLGTSKAPNPDAALHWIPLELVLLASFAVPRQQGET